MRKNRLYNPLTSILSACVLTLTLVFATPTNAQTPSQRLKNGEIRLGVYRDLSPMSFLVESEYKGFSVDLCSEIVERVAKKQSSKPVIKKIPIDVQNRFNQIDSSAIDIECGATTITQKRSEKYNFTYWIFVTGTNYLETIASSSRDGISGKTVAVMANSSNEVALNQHSTMTSSNYKKVTVKTADDGFQLLGSGGADAFAIDEILLAGWRSKQSSPENYKYGPRLLTIEPYGLMLPKNDPEWVAAVNSTLIEIYRDGGYERIYQRWFGGSRGLPLNSHMKNAMRLPTKYGIPE
jgi:glutamate/aspartate transport system substrate-binding protein